MNTNMKRIMAGIFLSLISCGYLSAQTLSDSTIKKIDSLFTKWNNLNSPGCTIGIVRNDSLLYAKGYGMSNLEYSVPNTPETIFHMASISKQFTAYSIVLLARQGKLSLDDDIRKYLTWFPDLKEKITIRQLLHHTSGVRDQWQLLAISGTRLDDVITQDQIIKILSKQQALNFTPGSQFNYSNSGFTMLAEIVKSVTGQTLRQFTDSAIFKPLGMINTHVHDDYTEIVKNRSYSYDRIDSNHFANSTLSYSVAGATSLFTNINDMSKWIMNFYYYKIGDKKDIEQLTEKGKLNNGKEINYALGISVDNYKGWRTFSHGGADAGYRTFITAFPDLKMGFIVFSNLGDFNTGGKAYEMADLFIKDTSHTITAAKIINKDSSKAILKDTQGIAKYMGDYISEDGAQFTYKLKNKKVYWVPYGQTYLLQKAKKDTFTMFVDSTVKFVFKETPAKAMMVEEYWPDNQRNLTKYIADSTQSTAQLKAYIGTYYCPELDCKYGIVVKENHLYFTNDKYNDARINLVGANDLTNNDYWWLDHVSLLRDKINKITGFEVNSGRVMHLRFNKIE